MPIAQRPRVLLVSTQDLPEVDSDMPPLLDALLSAGLDPQVVAWENPSVDWTSGAIAVLRSTWNYHHARDHFVAWARQTAQHVSLWNPPEVIAWNSHKSYLRDLLARGVAAVPTAWVAQGSSTPIEQLAQSAGWTDLVIKPAVSAGSFATERFSLDRFAEAQAHLARITRERDAMVQPYLASVDARGERSLIFIDGAFSHAIRKSPRLGDAPESVTGPVDVTPQELALAQAALACSPAPVLYGRVDVTGDPEGEPLVMELELIEPSLFFALCPKGAERLASAIARRC